MKRYIYILVMLISVAGCQPKKVEPPRIGKIWKASAVRENGVLVYTESNPASTRPGYARFRLDLTSTEQVVFSDIDGRRLVGQWSLSTDNNRLILQNLSPPPSESEGNIEFYITAPPEDQKLSLKRTNQSRKTGSTVNEYELVPE